MLHCSGKRAGAGKQKPERPQAACPAAQHQFHAVQGAPEAQPRQGSLLKV